MSVPYDRRADVFTDWLDAQVAGKSTPDHELAADPELADICTAADQFHGLNQRLGQYASFVSPTSSSWEDIMATNPTLRVSAPGQAPIATNGGRTPTWWRGESSRQRFDRFVTAALAAALVMAIGAGAWLAAEGSPFGGGNEPPATMWYGGFGPKGDDASSLVPEVTVSPDEQLSSIPYPTAAECTVELPTREWTQNYFEEVWTAEQSNSGIYEWPILPSSEDAMTIMQTFRMWQACQLVGVPRAKLYTLQSPWMTRTQGVGYRQDGEPLTPERLNFLVDVSMTGSEEEQGEILAAFYEGTPDTWWVPGTPVAGATPTAGGPMADLREEREYAAYPEGATPVARSEARSAWPTIFADGIEMIGPDRARADLYSVSPDTGEIMIVGGGADYAVELILVDGAWKIDFYGEAALG